MADMDVLSTYVTPVFGVCSEASHSFFVTCFSQIFAAICPLAVVVLYLSMTSSSAPRERLATAKVACWVAWGLMMATALGGPKTLEVVGIAIEAFNIAGGLLLIIIGFGMLRSDDPEIAVSKDEAAEIGQLPRKKRQDIAIAPLGVPIIAGPGVLTIVLANRAEANGTASFALCLLAISLAIFLIYWILILTSKGAKWLTPTILKLSFRLSGLFLLAVGVQMTMNGLKDSHLLANLAKL
jgi:multiple antibiotic resistance protein